MKYNAMKESCLTCRFWGLDDALPHTGGLASICRRHPPAIEREDGMSDLTGVWPTTWEGAWCGEYKAREVAP